MGNTEAIESNIRSFNTRHNRKTKCTVHKTTDPKKSVTPCTYQLQMKVGDWHETDYPNYQASIHQNYTLLTLKRTSPPPHPGNPISVNVYTLRLNLYTSSNLIPVRLHISMRGPFCWQINLKKKGSYPSKIVLFNGAIDEASIRFPGWQKEIAKNFFEDDAQS